MRVTDHEEIISTILIAISKLKVESNKFVLHIDIFWIEHVFSNTSFTKNISSKNQK